jgi:ribosome-binding ATPase YchF (GTP1/OBG family)
MYLAVYFLVSNFLTRWLPQAAGAIHSDFERGFICAEVMHYDELKELGTESAVKAAGKYRQEGAPTQQAGLERK